MIKHGALRSMAAPTSLSPNFCGLSISDPLQTHKDRWKLVEDNRIRSVVG